MLERLSREALTLALEDTLPVAAVDGEKARVLAAVADALATLLLEVVDGSADVDAYTDMLTVGVLALLAAMLALALPVPVASGEAPAESDADGDASIDGVVVSDGAAEALVEELAVGVDAIDDDALTVAAALFVPETAAVPLAVLVALDVAVSLATTDAETLAEVLPVALGRRDMVPLAVAAPLVVRDPVLVALTVADVVTEATAVVLRLAIWVSVSEGLSLCSAAFYLGRSAGGGRRKSRCVDALMKWAQTNKKDAV